MEYLGEFLSTTNKITEDSDQVIKYFYYRPERYDNRSADLENIFALRATSGFPQIGDVLSEASGYVINDIEINKRVDDTNTGVKNVSYVVQCTYELGTAVATEKFGKSRKNREQKKQEDVAVDKNGKAVDRNTPPWDLPNTFTRTPVQVEVPFIKGYDANNNATKDVVNKAGKRLLASTTRYRFEYNVKVCVDVPIITFDSLSGCYINDADWIPTETVGLNFFPAKTCLIFPPTYSSNYWQPPATPSGTLPSPIGYREYNVKFIYDPLGWDKVLLNIGTWAKFTVDSPAEQIFSYRTKNGNTWSELNYGNLAEVERARELHQTSGVVYEKVTEPLPLTLSGAVYREAITDVEHNPYLTCPFQEFPTFNFSFFAKL